MLNPFTLITLDFRINTPALNSCQFLNFSLWTKSQKKSKWFFQVDVSSKKRTNEFYFTTMKPQVDLFSFGFFEGIEDTKKTFRNYLTFRNSVDRMWSFKLENTKLVCTILYCRIENQNNLLTPLSEEHVHSWGPNTKNNPNYGNFAGSDGHRWKTAWPEIQSQFGVQN